MAGGVATFFVLLAKVFQSALEGAGAVAHSRLAQSAILIAFTVAAIPVAILSTRKLIALSLLWVMQALFLCGISLAWFGAALAFTRPVLPALGAFGSANAAIGGIAAVWRRLAAVSLAIGLGLSAAIYWLAPLVFGGELGGDVAPLGAVAVVLWIPAVVAVIPYLLSSFTGALATFSGSRRSRRCSVSASCFR